MNDNEILADSFVVKKRNLRVYRIQQDGNATILSISRENALHIFSRMEFRRLQAKRGR